MGFHPVEEKKAGVPESTDPKGFSLVEDLKLADDLKGPTLNPADGYQELQLSKPFSSQEEKSNRRFGDLRLWVEEFKEPTNAESTLDPVEKVRQELEPRQKEFTKTLRFLRERSVPITMLSWVVPRFSSSIFHYCDNVDPSDSRCKSHGDFLNLLKQLREKGQTWSFETSRDTWFSDKQPGVQLNYEAVSIIELGRDFTPPSLHINIPTLTLSVEMKEGEYYLILWNWLEEKPFFVLRCSPESLKEEKVRDALADQLRSAIHEHLKTFDLKAALAKLPPLTSEEKEEFEKRVVYRLNHPKGWSQTDISNAEDSWKRLTNRFDITLQGIGFQENVDRDNERPLGFDPIDFNFSKNAVEKLKGRALEINGFLNAIVLDVPDKATGFELGEDKRLLWDGNFIPDKYGSVIIPQNREHALSGRPYFMGFTILPPYFFSKDATPQTKTIGVDLSRFGFGDHPKLLTTQSLPPIRTPDAANPYYIYSTLPPSDQEKAERVYDTLQKLTSETESFFGFKPAERIQNIFFVPSNSWNASVRLTNPDTFFIWDEMLRDLDEGRADFVVPHEVFHGLDNQFKFSLHPGLFEMFTMLKFAKDTELFSVIDESHFLSTGMGGHSAGNFFEFFATLTNSLRAPEWDKKVAEMTPRVRGLYYHALQRLKAALVAKRPEIVSAPVYQLLEARITSLEADGTTYPPLEQVAKKPIGTLLTEAGVTVIKPKDFRKKVVEQRGPVVVVLYDEAFKEDIDFIRSVHSAMQNHAKVVAISSDEASNFLSLRYFEGRTSSLTAFVFLRGDLVERIEQMGYVGKFDDPHAALLKDLTLFVDGIHENPIPIVGPLIDFLTK